MKHLIASIGLSFLLTFHAFASPLLFKATKEVKSANIENLAPIASFDTAKYKEIRVGVVFAIGKIDNYFDGLDIIVRGTEDDSPIGIDIGRFRILNDKWRGQSILIHTPPAKIEVLTSYPGTYKVYIWGQ